MPKIDDLDIKPRRALNLFYVLDTSNSMTGDSIDTLNTAMQTTIEVLADHALKNADAQLKISVLEFNSGCEWLQPDGPEDAVDFIWTGVTAKGITDMGHALDELNSKLTKDEYLKSSTGAYLPIIIFMTDGFATDNYKKHLDIIRKNRWFAHATKIGFALGDNPDKQMIAEIVGNSEAVLATKDLDIFSRLIKFISTTSSMMCSSVDENSGNVSGADIVKIAVEEIGDNAKLYVGADDFVVDLFDEDFDDNDTDWG